MLCRASVQVTVVINGFVESLCLILLGKLSIVVMGISHSGNSSKIPKMFELRCKLRTDETASL